MNVIVSIIVIEKKGIILGYDYIRVGIISVVEGNTRKND